MFLIIFTLVCISYSIIIFYCLYHPTLRKSYLAFLFPFCFVLFMMPSFSCLQCYFIQLFPCLNEFCTCRIALSFFFLSMDFSPFFLEHFLDAFSHLYKRVCPSVGRSVRRSVRPSHTSWISDISTEMKQNSNKDMMLRHLKVLKAKIEQKSIHNMKLPF